MKRLLKRSQAIARKRRREISMAYRFQVNQHTCINCGICMDLCPVRCLDMTRPSGDGERAQAEALLTPIPGDAAARSWMMLVLVQVAQCIGCRVCAQECSTNAISALARALGAFKPGTELLEQIAGG